MLTVKEALAALMPPPNSRLSASKMWAKYPFLYKTARYFIVITESESRTVLVWMWGPCQRCCPAALGLICLLFPDMFWIFASLSLLQLYTVLHWLPLLFSDDLIWFLSFKNINTVTVSGTGVGKCACLASFLEWEAFDFMLSIRDGGGRWRVALHTYALIYIDFSGGRGPSRYT